MSEVLRLQAVENLKNQFADNPCRAIAIGMSLDGRVRLFSGIMGRSSNSQNRVYVTETNEFEQSLRTQAFDPSKVEDPRLIIYNVMRCIGEPECHVVSNGDQTDTVIDAMTKEDFLADASMRDVNPVKAFYDALESRFCEPDAPIFTPRISGLYVPGQNNVYFSLIRAVPEVKAEWVAVEKASGLTKDQFRKPGMKDSEVNDAYNRAIAGLLGIKQGSVIDYQKFPSVRCNFSSLLVPGFGHLLTTYKPGDSKSLPSYDGEPVLIPVRGSLRESMDSLWKVMSPDWRVAVAGKEINGDDYRIEIINKHGGAV